MKRGVSILLPAFVAAFVQLKTNAQPIDTVLLAELGRYQHPYVLFPDSFSAPTLSSRIDRLGRPYLYMACSDSGLITLDISIPSAPFAVDHKPPSVFGGLKVMNVEQVDLLLYLSLGGIEGTSQNTGMATVDVSDPTAPAILDVWDGGSTFPNGCAIVRVDAMHAYLGAMESGIVVMDVSDPADLQLVSTYQPDPTWPGIAGYPPNGRGMDIHGSILYLAYDAGGLRTIDIGDPAALSQIGQYVNPNQPPLTPNAANNVVVIGDRAYVTVDFCGLEVVDVSDPANMSLVTWLNPWSCNGFSWFGSDGHTNELITTLGDSLLFVSGADSEILIYDITDPDVPVLKGGHILPNDSAATWGVDVFGDRVVGNYINTHGLPFQPYDSKYGGVVLFNWEAEFATAIGDMAPANGLILSPNPADDVVHLHLAPMTGPAELVITDALGRSVLRRAINDVRAPVDVSSFIPGCYVVRVLAGGTALAPVRLMVR